jgi:hypothetical protein
MAKQKIKKMKDHDDEVEDKKLVKKMVKGECMKSDAKTKKRK